MLTPPAWAVPHSDPRAYGPCDERTIEHGCVEVCLYLCEPSPELIEAVAAEWYDGFTELVELYRPVGDDEWRSHRHGMQIPWSTGRARSAKSTRKGFLEYFSREDCPRILSLHREVSDPTSEFGTSTVLALDVFNRHGDDNVSLHTGARWTWVRVLAAWRHGLRSPKELADGIDAIFRRVVASHLAGTRGAAWFSSVEKQDAVNFVIYEDDAEGPDHGRVFDPSDTLPAVQWATWIPPSVRSRFESAATPGGPYVLVDAGTELIAYLDEDLWEPREEIESAAAAIIGSIDPRWAKLYSNTYYVAIEDELS